MKDQIISNMSYILANYYISMAAYGERGVDKVVEQYALKVDGFRVAAKAALPNDYMSVERKARELADNYMKEQA